MDASNHTSNAVLRPISKNQRRINQEILGSKHESGDKVAFSTRNASRSYTKEYTDDQLDLDDEGSDIPAFDDTGMDVYMKTCLKLNQTTLRQVVQGLKTTQSIHIKDRGLGSRSILCISNALLVNMTVTNLVLDGNGLTDKALKYLAWMLSENVYIKTLSLNENEFTNDGIEDLCMSLKVNSSLTKLSLSGNKLQDSSAAHIAAMLQTNTVLQDLNLSYNCFSDRGAKYFAQAISLNDYLRFLDFSWNRFRPSGIAIICQAVQESVMLKSLNISMNGISLSGCIALSLMLQNNDAIMFLNISQSRLQDQDVMKLVPALTKNESLRTLNVSHNPLTSGAVVALLEAIKLNEGSNLLHLDVNGIPIIRSTLFFVHQLQQNRPKFHFYHGGLISHDGPLVEAEHQLIAHCDPVELLRWFVKEKRIKLQSFDSECWDSYLLTKSKMKTFMKTIGYELKNNLLDLMFHQPGHEPVDYFDIQTLFM